MVQPTWPAAQATPIWLASGFGGFVGGCAPCCKPSEHAYRLGLDVSLAETMDGQARWVVQEVQVQPKPDTLLHVIEPALLRKVAPEAVQLRH